MESKVLTPNQQRILEEASRSKDITGQFFLTGGTALSAFYYGHRFSEDLDFFSETWYSEPILLKWVAEASKKVRAVRTEQEFLKGQHIFYFYFSDNSFVKVDFAYFPFGHLGEFIKFNDLKVTSMLDVAVNKAQAIISRKRSRDYLDLYLCMEELKLKPLDIIRNYKLKFDVDLSIGEIINSFTKVLDSHDLPRFLGDYDWSKVESFFLKEAEKLKPRLVS